MRFIFLFLLCLTACRADDIAHAAGQIFNQILPNLISNSVTNQQGNTASNTLSQIGTVVGGVVDYAKKKSYDELLRQVQDSTSDDDLLRVSDEMFNADINNAFNYIQVNLQGKTSPMSNKDEAPSNLLNVPENVWSGPTIRPFVALFDNYHKNVIRPEFVTPNEETEQTTYINTILATGPIRSLMAFLVNKGLTQMNEYNEQVELLKKIWFTKYARHWTGLCKCSCAFENIFMAELKSNEVLGLHSWLFFAKRELDHKANYLGHIDKLDLSGLIRQLPTLAFSGGGLWMGLEFHMKYVIAYGTTAAFARLDNMEPPPTPRCIARIHLYSQMWRHFDVGLYNFLVKYIYKPGFSTISSKSSLSKLYCKLLASLATFVFIFLWHGTFWDIFIWSSLNYIGIALENLGKALSKTEKYLWFKKTILKTEEMETRVIALACVPLITLSAISNFYLFAGSDIGNLYFEYVAHPTLWTFTIWLVSLYCFCQVCIALEDVPSRTDVKKL